MDSSGVCNKTSNNKYLNCPARSYAGGMFTDYRPNCDVENSLRVKNGLSSNYAYRQFLINNAEKLMQVNRDYNENKNGCAPCNSKPVMVESMCGVTRTSATCEPFDPHGLGQRSVAVQEEMLNYAPGMGSSVPSPANILNRQ